MHDTGHILGTLSGLWTTSRLQWQVPNIVLEQTRNISNSQDRYGRLTYPAGGVCYWPRAEYHHAKGQLGALVQAKCKITETGALCHDMVQLNWRYKLLK